GIPGVTGLHDLHVWSITSGKISLTSHLVYDPALVDAEALLGTVKALLHDRYEIEHSTLQLETSACAQAEEPLAY
ncbi:cation transporter, partial [Pseudomonas aeruginosa]|nr:cation transporter [Pseudomonas aeruginosa]